jgi:nucleotide-binding universal stress UspA family protein
MHRILLPYDGSSHARHAAQVLAGLAASGSNLQVHVLNVQENPVYAGGLIDDRVMRQIEDALLDQGRKLLLQAAEVLAAGQVPHQLHVQIGAVAQTIASQAQSLDCESIVMGCRGLGALSGLVLGSTATRVVHLSPLPVTLVK